LVPSIAAEVTKFFLRLKHYRQRPAASPVQS
jgi:hypothetical protein